LRELAKLPSGSSATKRITWYLAECLSFVKDFVGKHKKSASNVTIEENAEEAQETEEISEEIVTENDDNSPSIAEVLEATAIWSTSSQMAPTRRAPKRKIVGVEAVTQPIIEFFKSRTVVVNEK